MFFSFAVKLISGNSDTFEVVVYRSSPTFIFIALSESKHYNWLQWSSRKKCGHWTDSLFTGSMCDVWLWIQTVRNQ